MYYGSHEYDQNSCEICVRKVQNVTGDERYGHAQNKCRGNLIQVSSYVYA